MTIAHADHGQCASPILTRLNRSVTGAVRYTATGDGATLTDYERNATMPDPTADPAALQQETKR